jgi:predicted lipopolysaccharide heptosyltransferase III
MEHLIAESRPRIPAERILVIQFRRIGDVLLSTPVLRALRCYYPQSYIAFLTEPSPGRVLQENPLLDEVIIRPRHATWYQQWQLLRHIRRQRFELVIDLIGNPRSAVLTRLSGAKHRLAFARFPRSLLYTMLVTHHHPVPEYTVAKRLRLLEPLGIRATDLTPSLPYTQREQDEVDTFLRTQAITSEDLLICIDPTHHVPTRQWPGAHFSALADMLSERLGARVLLLWGPGEEAQVQAIAAAARSRPVLVPAWDLATLAALLDQADLFVGCNSAPLHIAVSQGLPTLTIMGATLSANWIPPEPQHRAVFAGLPCQPCEKNFCGPPLNTACLRTLMPATVFAAVQACVPWIAKLRYVSPQRDHQQEQAP